jgi:hypothetical protein
MRFSFQSCFRLFWCASILLLLTSCASYHLGRHALPPFKTLYVEAVENDSYAPQIQALYSNQLRQAFLAEGYPILVEKDVADVTLQVTITKYTQTGTAFREDDSKRARQVSISLSAKCTLKDNETGKIYFQNKSVSASSSLGTQGRFQGNAYQLMPIITEKLAKATVNAVVNVW